MRGWHSYTAASYFFDMFVIITFSWSVYISSLPQKTVFNHEITYRVSNNLRLIKFIDLNLLSKKKAQRGGSQFMLFTKLN